MLANDEQRTSLESHQTDTPNAQQPTSQRSTTPACKDTPLSPGRGAWGVSGPLCDVGLGCGLVGVGDIGSIRFRGRALLVVDGDHLH